MYFGWPMSGTIWDLVNVHAIFYPISPLSIASIPPSCLPFRSLVSRCFWVQVSDKIYFPGTWTRRGSKEWWKKLKLAGTAKWDNVVLPPHSVRVTLRGFLLSAGDCEESAKRQGTGKGDSPSGLHCSVLTKVVLSVEGRVRKWTTHNLAPLLCFAAARSCFSQFCDTCDYYWKCVFFLFFPCLSALSATLAISINSCVRPPPLLRPLRVKKVQNRMRMISISPGAVVKSLLSESDPFLQTSVERWLFFSYSGFDYFGLFWRSWLHLNDNLRTKYSNKVGTVISSIQSSELNIVPGKR